MDELDIFRSGMKREPGVQIDIDSGRMLELGPGQAPHPAATEFLDQPYWNGEDGFIPHDTESFDHIWCSHFLEHIKNVVPLLSECQRVLKFGGTMNIVVPYYSSNLQAKDLDHKNQFTERTWETLFKNKYYDNNYIDWCFEVNFNMIMGTEERNLCLCTQLTKESA